jgi:hypothetical protein
VGVAATWWLVHWSQVHRSTAPGTLAGPVLVGLPIALAVFRGLGFAVESLFYTAWWRSCGHAFSFTTALPWFATLSLLDAWASTLRGLARDLGEPWLAGAAFLTGAGVYPNSADSSAPGLWTAFADVGLLSLGRILGTVWIQTHQTGRGPLGPLGLTASVWLVFRLISWWASDLMRGASPA